MRTDLTAAFIAAKNAPFRRPRQLMIFRFPEAGEVYVSDQPLGAADGLSHTYLPLVESWGDLQDSAGNASDQEQSEIRQMTVTLWNGGANPFSDYFLGEYPEHVEVELYQWFAGLAASDAALIDRFVVSDPIEFDEASRLLSLDLVSLAGTLDAPCGAQITRYQWPQAADDAVGCGIPLAFGSPGRIKALQAVSPIVLTLKGSVLANTMTLMLYEDLSDYAFPATAVVKIDEELIRVSKGSTTDRLTVVQRGYTSRAAVHLDKRQVIQVINNHTFLLCEGPIAQIASVHIDGYQAPSGTYTFRPDLNPARIIFTETPWVKKFGEGTRFLEMQFDGLASGNTALQAANAFDAADLSTAAIIKPGHACLALRQSTVNQNRGEILRVYLAVEHWEAGNFAADYADVWISGIGIVGRLSRPNPDDIIDIDADVDVDHGHFHALGGRHVHDYTPPTVHTAVAVDITTDNPEHTHEGSGGTQDISQTQTNDSTIWADTYPGQWREVSMPFTYYTGASKRILQMWFYCGGRCQIWLGNVMWKEFSGSVQYTGAEFDVTSLPVYAVTVKIAPTSTQGVNLQFRKATITSTVQAAVLPTATSVSASATSGADSTASGGAVKNTGVVGVKDKDDVEDFGGDNRILNLNDQANPSRTVCNIFDVTHYVNFNWSWFSGREIRVTYHDGGDANAKKKAVYILHAFFDIEYVPSEIVYSNNISAEVTGLSTLVRPDQVIKSLLVDKGSIAETSLDTTAWGAVASKYSSQGYRLDGLIDPTLTIREAISRICLQTHSRLFTSGGKFKLVLREGHPATKAWTASLTPDAIQARSISVARQPVSEISNKVQLFYQRDWTKSVSDTSGYLQSVTKQDLWSVSKFGLKTHQERYNCDLIGSSAMANKVATFYLQVDAWPSSFYTFLTYLQRFNLEKEDVITVSSDFNQMAKVPMVVRAVDRVFGSGKNGGINLFRVIAENLYYILKKVSLADNVLIMEGLSFFFTEIGEFAENIHGMDDLLIHLDLTQSDSALLADTFALLMDWRPQILDTIHAMEQLYGDMECLHDDTVRPSDDLEFWSAYGFGSGGFGRVRFGGLTEWRQKSPDQVYAFMAALVVTMACARADSVVVADTLVFSTGFGGGHLSSGFGRTPFGA